MRKQIRHGSLFSGIGGFDLAAEWMGWKNVFNCEIDPFCRRLLKFYWPDAKSYSDIKEFPAQQYRGGVDVISGGFPCQPFSVAGARKGTQDPRYLWPPMFAVIKSIQPCIVVAENVPYLIGWKRGMVFDQVHLDLEAAGYQVASVVLPASGKDVPHLRNKVWKPRKTSNTLTGGKHGVTLMSLGHLGMLPTPVARDWKGPLKASFPV